MAQQSERAEHEEQRGRHQRLEGVWLVVGGCQREDKAQALGGAAAEGACSPNSGRQGDKFSRPPSIERTS